MVFWELPPPRLPAAAPIHSEAGPGTNAAGGPGTNAAGGPGTLPAPPPRAASVGTARPPAGRTATRPRPPAAQGTPPARGRDEDRATRARRDPPGPWLSERGGEAWASPLLCVLHPAAETWGQRGWGPRQVWERLD
jgi:hypothetical protein